MPGPLPSGVEGKVSQDLPPQLKQDSHCKANREGSHGRKSAASSGRAKEYGHNKAEPRTSTSRTPAICVCAEACSPNPPGATTSNAALASVRTGTVVTTK